MNRVETIPRYPGDSDGEGVRMPLDRGQRVRFWLGVVSAAAGSLLVFGAWLYCR